MALQWRSEIWGAAGTVGVLGVGIGVGVGVGAGGVCWVGGTGGAPAGASQSRFDMFFNRPEAQSMQPVALGFEQVKQVWWHMRQASRSTFK